VTRKALVLGVLVALLVSGSAQASDTYRITAGGNQDWGPSSGAIDETGSTQLEASGTMEGDNNAVGSVDYHLQAGPGIVRAAMDGNVTVPSSLGYPFNPSLQAVATTELTIHGPDPELTTSLNLHVDGFVETPVCGGGTFCGALSVHITGAGGTTGRGDSEFTTLGETRGNELGLAFDPVPGGYHVHGDVTSQPFGLTTNTPHGIGIVLNLSGRFAGNAATSTFGAGFDDPQQRLQVSFAPDGPVLNDIPAGFTVSGSGVVDNRWDDPYAGDLVVADCDDDALANVTQIRGSLILRELADCPEASFPKLEHIGGDVVIDGDHAPHVAFPGPVVVDGSVRVVGNDGGGEVGIGSGSVAGTVDISGNGGDLDIGIGSAAGSVDISGTGGDLDVGIGSAAGSVDISGTGGDLDVGIGSAAGSVDISGTGSDLDVEPGDVGGDLDISDNPDAGVINAGGGQIGGDLTVTDNGTAVVNADDSLTVSGDADVETGGGGMLDLSGVDAGGDETVAADGADGVIADTAGGTTDVSILGGTAAMHVVLPDDAFDRPVAFTITRQGDEPAEGGVDPLAGYAFAFAVPALDADARLAFTIDLAALDAPTRAALLAGIASGSATLVSRADAPGSAYAAFARCAGTQTPAADGCVAVTLLRADGSVAPAGTQPALARFDGVAGHFSTWAVALLRSHGTPPGGGPPAGSGPPPGGSTPTGPTAAQIRALLRTEIAPHGKAGRIRALLRRAYRLHFRVLTAGTAKVGWYRLRKGRKPVLIAKGRRTFAGPGGATMVVKLTAPGRRQLRRANRLGLTARGTFTPASGAPVKAARRFTLRRDAAPRLRPAQPASATRRLAAS
jgi:hypothetical protein